MTMEVKELLIIAAKGKVKADPHLLRLARETWRNAKKRRGLIPRRLLGP